MTATTIGDQLAALDALAQITASLSHLPAADVAISPITPDELSLSIHDNLDGFEQWRAALGIPTTAVDHCQRPGQGHMTLKAITHFAGATVELVGFAPALASIKDGER